MLFRKPPVFVMDIETLADLRVTRFLEYGLVTGRLLLPEPAETDENTRHVAGRAREAIDRLKKIKGLQVKVEPRLADPDRLLAEARRAGATLLTARPDLKAAANGLNVVSIAEIYTLFKPVQHAGNVVRLRISKRGREKDESIGYVDGVKVVVEKCAAAIGQELEVVVMGSLDTEAGQVVFARPRFTELR